MTTYDDATRAFIEKVSGVPMVQKDPGAAADEDDVKRYLKRTKTVLQILQNPAKNIPRAVVKESLSGFSKQSSVRAADLATYLDTHYAEAWHDWEPETMRQVLAEEHGYEGDDVLNMVGALQTVLSTDLPFEHWHIFEKVGHGLYGNIVDFALVQPLEPTELAGVFKLLLRLRPDATFEPEIYAYAAGCCHDAGMVYMPGDLFPPQCQAYLEAQSYVPSFTAQVQGLWDEGAAPLGDRTAVQLARLKEIREFVSDA